jgi:hypothetical protein
MCKSDFGEEFPIFTMLERLFRRAVRSEAASNALNHRLHPPLDGYTLHAKADSVKRGEKIFTQKFRVAVLKDRRRASRDHCVQLTPLKREIRFPETFGIGLLAYTNSTEA